MNPMVAKAVGTVTGARFIEQNKGTTKKLFGFRKIC